MNDDDDEDDDEDDEDDDDEDEDEDGVEMVVLTVEAGTELRSARLSRAEPMRRRMMHTTHELIAHHDGTPRTSPIFLSLSPSPYSLPLYLVREIGPSRDGSLHSLKLNRQPRAFFSRFFSTMASSPSSQSLLNPSSNPLTSKVTPKPTDIPVNQPSINMSVSTPPPPPTSARHEAPHPVLQAAAAPRLVLARRLVYA
ncbi:hypothetical protein XA68_14218 [Ophiocordyceps unilateralis]|uniref:Uncharacterized protein n=1 Tax=Ophiocordyceps unilateralis TaxID=268505 RepID=A0A2A9P973_OPHUN|nr:hypothetical protein XA68_14218 [Ophiocordyceps unilateralis]